MSLERTSVKAHSWPVPIEGGCSCSALRYRVKRSPIIIHCCNCEACQQDTGSAFALNMVVEANEVELLPSSSKQSKNNDQSIVKPKLIVMPSESGQGVLVARCPICFVACWSHYPSAGPSISFIRSGTLNKASVDGKSIKDLLKPDMYIFTKWKHPWVTFPESEVEAGKVVDEFYDPGVHWSDDAKQRFAVTKSVTDEWVKRGRDWSELGEVVDPCSKHVRPTQDDTQSVTQLVEDLKVS